jgi:hypothetical protein
MKISDMLMPSRTLLGRTFGIGLDQLADHPPSGGIGHAKIAVEKKPP